MSSVLIKSSTRTVELLCRLHKNEGARLSSECIYLDVLHSRFKSWETYTLSCYDSILKELVKLITAEYYEIFFDNCKEQLKFNPFQRTYNKHPENQMAIKKVFGENVYQEGTLSCKYHFNKSVEKHKKNMKNISTYKSLCADMKELTRNN